MVESKPLKAYPMLEQQNAHICQWDLTILSSEHRCFLSTCYHNWWDGNSCGKWCSPGWSCKGHPVTHHFCPGCSWRMMAEHSATYVSTITVKNYTASTSPLQETSTMNKVNPGVGASATLDLYSLLFCARVKGSVCQEKKPSLKVNCVSEAKA